MKFAVSFALFLLPTAVSGLLKAPIDDTIDQDIILPSPVAPVPAPTTPTTTSCQCRTDYDCLQSKYCGNTCVFSPYSRTGMCKSVMPPPTKPPTKAPTKAPTRKPTRPPTRPPIKPTTGGGGCSCQFDYQCIQSCPYTNKCVFSPYSGGQCQNVASGTLTPTKAPIEIHQCCLDPRSIPTECEVRILIEIMEQAVGLNFAILAQWLRQSFHDAGTFNKRTGEGGANGCLLNHPPMRTQPENLMLDLALNTLATVKTLWEGHPDTCLNVSAADMTQFAGWFAVIRQKGVPGSGLTAAKKDEIVQKTNWGRPDEQVCDIAWTDNLPGFQVGTGQSRPNRCKIAGGEIKKKMMDRNGFSAIEAAALMGAHTIGMTRNVFGSALSGTWTVTGADNATPQGPVFDFSFHKYLKNDIVEDDAFAFAGNILAFNQDFSDWFRESGRKINYLDSDVTLAFPSVDTLSHPDFHTFTAMFAADNDVFIKHFEVAFHKMTALGVAVALVAALPCSAGCTGTAVDLDPVLSDEMAMTVQREVLNSIVTSDAQLQETAVARESDIKRLTTKASITEEFLN